MPLISSKNQKAGLESAERYRDEPQKFWSKVLWTFYQSGGKAKMVMRKHFTHDPNHRNSSVKHSECSIMSCMAASGIASHIFIHTITYDESSRMVYRNILFAMYQGVHFPSLFLCVICIF